MEYFTIEKLNGHKVSCVKEMPDRMKGVVIVVHGFSSNRECATYKLLLRRLPEAGYGMIGIELPGHGSSESSQEMLRIPGAIDSIEAAEKYASAFCPNVPILYFASSFGAYLTGIYISTRNHRGEKAFFRSAAVNMPSLFRGEQMERELREKGYFDTNEELGSPVMISREMYCDLKTTDLFRVFNPGETSVMMVHGEKDATIDPAAARAFSVKFGVPLVMFADEGHSLGTAPGTPDCVADLAIEFYGG